jgi:hypothetical protein
MNTLGQLAATITVALGAGLFAYSRHLDPPLNVASPAFTMASMSAHTHEVAALACGWGIGFITLGVLGLAVPWINAYVKRQCVHAGIGAT